jgi:hypothetical protein
VNDSAADPSHPSPRPWRGHAAWTAALITLLLVSCAEEPLPQRGLSLDDCLASVQLDRLDEAIKRCNRVVAAFPGQPQPLNERFLLHWLKGEEQAACRDIRQADALVRRLPPARVDRLLRRDLELRLASCRDTPGAQRQGSAAAPAGPASAASSPSAPR